MIVLAWSAVASADPAPLVGESSANLDGLYVWLGPSGSASTVDGDLDSTFGAELAVVSVEEKAMLGTIGGALGASRWTERGGGRVWLDVVAGSRLGPGDGIMMGLSAGAILELDDLEHPRIGGSVGVWAFLGVTPFARVGAVDELGMFAEVGIHLVLPVWRH